MHIITLLSQVYGINTETTQKGTKGKIVELPHIIEATGKVCILQANKLDPLLFKKGIIRLSHLWINQASKNETVASGNRIFNTVLLVLVSSSSLPPFSPSFLLYITSF